VKIALVAPDCNKRDGQARYVAEIAEHLVRSGHDALVASVGYDGVDEPAVCHLPIRSPARATRRRFFAMLRAAPRALARQRVDLVHALGASHPRPDVITAQFCQAAWDEVARTEMPPELRGGLGEWLLRKTVAAVERRVFARPRRLIVVAERVARDVERFYGRKDGVVVLPQGVDLDDFHPRRAADRGDVRSKYGVSDGAFMALFLGEFERKNLRTVIAALARMSEPIVLLAVGGSDPAPYRRLAAELGVGERCVIAGRTERPASVMAAADALVFPTLYDPYGTVTLEAAACGTPVITSTRPGFAEAMTDGEHGLLLDDPLDAAALAVHLDRLAIDRDHARRMGAAARKLAEGFSWARVADETIAIYRELLDEKLEAQT